MGLMDAWKVVFYTVLAVFKFVVTLVAGDSIFFKEIKGDIVLVTGGGSGIGRLMCLKLAQRGAIIVTWDVNAKGNQETVSMIQKEGGKATAYTVDLTNKEQVYEAADKVRQEVGTVSILINNAGIVSGSSILDTSDSKIIQTFDVNVLAHFWTIKAFLPAMLETRRGHIVTIASIAGQCGANKLVDYCSSKFAAVGLNDSLTVELFRQGHSDYIKTTVVCPYVISTGMFAGVQSSLLPILEPKDVAERVVTGILSDQDMIIIPGWTALTLALKSMLPVKAMLWMSQAFGFNTAMDQFTGRLADTNSKTK